MLLIRLRRIEAQVGGIQQRNETDRSYLNSVQQINALIAAAVSVTPCGMMRERRRFEKCSQCCGRHCTINRKLAQNGGDAATHNARHNAKRVWRSIAFSAIRVIILMARTI